MPHIGHPGLGAKFIVYVSASVCIRCPLSVVRCPLSLRHTLCHSCHNPMSFCPPRFAAFCCDIDDANDRRERLIKVGTAHSPTSRLSYCPHRPTVTSPTPPKKVIFLLHRLVADSRSPQTPAHSLSAPHTRPTPSSATSARFRAHRPSLARDRFWRHQQTVSPGLQEYIEALSFAHYLEHRRLVTYHEVQHALSDPSGQPYASRLPLPLRPCSVLTHVLPAGAPPQLFPLPVADYLLGLSDLTGELMALRHLCDLAARRAHAGCRSLRLCARVQSRCVPPPCALCAPITFALPLTHMRAPDFECLTPYIRELTKKTGRHRELASEDRGRCVSHPAFSSLLPPVAIRTASGITPSCCALQCSTFSYASFLSCFLHSPSPAELSPVVAYAITVRSSEYDLPPEMLDDIVRRHISAAPDAHLQATRSRRARVASGERRRGRR